MLNEITQAISNADPKASVLTGRIEALASPSGERIVVISYAPDEETSLSPADAKLLSALSNRDGVEVLRVFRGTPSDDAADRRLVRVWRCGVEVLEETMTPHQFDAYIAASID